MMSRRAMMMGGAVMAASARQACAAPADLTARLDAAAAERDPVRALALLAIQRAGRLTGAARLDLVTARAGLAADVALIRHGIDPRAPTLRSAADASFRLVLQRKIGPMPGVRAIERRLIVEHRRVDARAARLFEKIGIDGATIGARYRQLWGEQTGRYPDTDAGCDALVAEMNGLLPPLVALIPALMGAVPPYCLNVAASRGSLADQAASKVGVRLLPTAAMFGGYVIDLKRIADRPRWSLPSVVAHELLPGHLLQLPMEAAANPHPLRLEYAPAFAEGWGIHIERLVAEAGVWRDPRAMLGYLHWRLFRIARARADIGIHVHRWSADEAQARLMAWQGEPAYFAPFDSDVARIAAAPAVRTAEMLAALAIEDGAQGKNGRALIAFHQSMLVDGRMRNDDIARRAAT